MRGDVLVEAAEGDVLGRVDVGGEDDIDEEEMTTDNPREEEEAKHAVAGLLELKVFEHFGGLR